MNLAPISIPVYKRVNHLKKCIDSLKKNPLAKDSTIYIFSDYFAKNSDRKGVLQVRDFIKCIDGFKNVILIEQKINKGMDNILESIEVPLETFGAVIYLEEDLVVSDNFLNYMNEAIEFYGPNKKVFSVTGFTQPPCVSFDYDRVKASTIFTAWSCVFWADKYSVFKKFSKSGVKNLIDPITITQVIYKHSFQQFVYMFFGFIDNKISLDWSIGFYMWKKKMFQVFPMRSHVIQNGFDGSGWHCGESIKFKASLSTELNYKFTNSFNVCESDIIFNTVKRFYGLGLKNDIIFLKRNLNKAFRRLIPWIKK